MPTIIKTLCPYCGELQLGPKDLHLQTYDQGDRDYYEFICPECEQLIVKPADKYIVRALRMGRVPETHTLLPDEILDPKREQGPLGYNDLLDFVLELGVTDDLSSSAA